MVRRPIGGTVTSAELDSKSKNHFAGFPSHQITSDDITRMGEKWIQIENLPESLPDGRYILNLRNEHWIVLLLQKPNAFIFDPLSTQVNKQDIPTKHKNLTTWLKSRAFTTIYANDIKVQPKSSWACGYYCLYFVKHVPKGKLTEEGFDLFILNHFRSGDDDFNIQKLIAWTNKVKLT